MKFYKCVNEVKPSYVVDTEPQFSETVLYQNQGTAVENEITLSNDYHNYDIIKIICCDTGSNDALFPSYATPSILDFLITDNNPYVNCNMIDTNHYIVYQINSSTSLTYQSGSNVYVTQIIGLKCTNGTIAETEIFSRQRSNSWTEINTELNLFEFNMILTLTSTGAGDKCVINNLVFMKPIGNDTYYGSTDINNQLNIWRVMYYGSSVFAGLTNHYISPCLWYYVTGLKFIPKWDYYIENLIFNGTSSTVIDTELPIFNEINKDRDFEIEFKDNGTRQVGENWYPYFSIIDNSYIYYEYIAFLGTSVGRLNNITDYQAIKNESPQTVISGTESAALGNGKTVRIVKQGNKFTVWYDGSLIQTRTFSDGMPSTDANLKLGIGKNGSTTYYGNNSSGFKYFGFRWLS